MLDVYFEFEGIGPIEKIKGLDYIWNIIIQFLKDLNFLMMWKGL
jgi:hypothetical protein